MVSKASEDFPEPDRPVNTISLARGSFRATFLRLCSRAPRITSMSATGRGYPSAGPEHMFDVSPTNPVRHAPLTSATGHSLRPPAVNRALAVACRRDLDRVGGAFEPRLDTPVEHEQPSRVQRSDAAGRPARRQSPPIARRTIRHRPRHARHGNARL